MLPMDLQDRVAHLNSLIVQLKFDEALEEFYDAEIISVENENPPTVGLVAYKVSAKKFMDNLSNYSATLKNQIISENMIVTEWHYRFDHKEWGKWDRQQITVQRWRNGKIYHERHHYNMN